MPPLDAGDAGEMRLSREADRWSGEDKNRTHIKLASDADGNTEN